MSEPALAAIYYAPAHKEPLRPLDSAKLVSGRGLEGDRFFNQPGGIVSLIEQEAVDAFNRETGLDIDPGQSRRNLLTRGVRLNPLVGKTFFIGDIELHGFELCDPCATLGRDLAADGVTPAQVVRHFAVSAGLRAYVRGTGVIRSEMPIRIA